MPRALHILVLVGVISISGCAGIRKAKAGKDLHACEFSLSDWSLKAVVIDSTLFPKAKEAVVSPFPNPQIMSLARDLLRGETHGNIGTAWIHVNLQVKSSGTDTIWVRSLAGTISLDTLIHATWTADTSATIYPGNNTIPMTMRLPMDARLFQIMTPDSLYLEGGMVARLDSNGNDIPLSFRKVQPNPKDRIEFFLKNAKQSIFDALLNGWANSIRPQIPAK